MDTITTKLGEFKYNEKYNCYEYKNDNYGLYIYCDESNNYTNALETFKKYEDKMNELEDKCRKYIAEMLLDEGNDWLYDVGEDAIDEEEFMERIYDPYFYFNNNGTIDVYYDDGDIFAGHMINFTIESDGSFTTPNIAG